jgi:hypothetical protein
MAGRPRKDHLPTRSQYRPKRLRRRKLIEELPAEQQLFICTLTEHVQQLIPLRDSHDGAIPEQELKEHASELNIAPYKLLIYIRQAEDYHMSFPKDPLTSAFTPPRPVRSSKPKSQLSDPSVQDQPGQQPRKAPPRKRPHISSIADQEERERLIAYSAAIAELLELQTANGGVLPDGELGRVAGELNQSLDWVDKRMRHLRAYRTAYAHEPDYTDANAFTPVEMGRPKGRSVSREVLEAIENAALNKEWPSVNSDGTVSKISLPLGPKLIHSLIQKRFPEQDYSEATIWRIFNDIREQHRSTFEASRTDIGVLQTTLPYINNKVESPWERAQLDMRSLPLVVDYEGIICTVRTAVLIDDCSEFRIMSHLLPAKRLDDDNEVLGQDYTCRKIRELIAIGFLRAGGRVMTLYLDNGSQLAKKALGAYMQFMVAPGEEQTRIISRKVKHPRGGGGIESTLGWLRHFMNFRPGYITEDQFRQSMKEKKKIKIPTFKQLVEDFDMFTHNVNHEPDENGVIAFDVFHNNPKNMLTLPSPENLALFAMTSTIKPRRPDAGGFNMNGKQYVPYTKEMCVYEKLSDLAESAKTDKKLMIDVKVCELGEYSLPFFSLDGQVTWHFAIDKELDGDVSQQHNELMAKIEAMIKRRGSEAAQFIKVLLSHIDKPLVINGLRKRPVIETLEAAQTRFESARQSPHFQHMPLDVTEELKQPQETPNKEAHTATTKQSGKQSRPAASKQTSPPAVAPDWLAKQSKVDEEPEVDDIDDFLNDLQDEFAKKRGQ